MATAPAPSLQPSSGQWVSSGEGQTGLRICPARKVLPRASYGICVPAPETRHQHAAVLSQPAARIPLRIRQGLRLPRPLPSHSLNSSSRRLQGPSAALSSAYASEDFCKPLGCCLQGMMLLGLQSPASGPAPGAAGQNLPPSLRF